VQGNNFEREFLMKCRKRAEIDTANIEAECKNGVLAVKLPKTEAAKSVNARSKDKTPG